MTTYHLRADKSDSNSGLSEALAWQTLNHAGSVMTGGDILLCHDTGGVYFVTSEHSFTISGSAGNPITITNAPGESPVWDATGATMGSTDAILSVNNNSHYGVVNGLELRNNAQGSALGRGLEVSSSATNKVHDIEFTFLTIHDIYTRGFGGGGNDITITDSTFYNCVMENEAEALGGGGGWAAVISSFNFSDSTLPVRWIVGRCHVYNSWGEGVIALRIGGSGADGMTIFECLIENTYSKLIYIDKAHGCLVYGNDLTFNNPAYNKNSHATDGITWAVEGTPVHANYGVDTIYIYNNAIRGCRDGVSCFTDSNDTASTWRNIFVYYNSSYALSGDGWKTLAKGASANTPTGCELKNNIIDGGWTIASASGWTYAFNCWIDAIPSTGTHTSSINDDPEYSAPTTTAGDADGLILLSTSPCIGAGTAISITTDFDGNSRGSPPDMGAFEYQVPAPSTVKARATIGAR